LPRSGWSTTFPTLPPSYPLPTAPVSSAAPRLTGSPAPSTRTFASPTSGPPSPTTRRISACSSTSPLPPHHHQQHGLHYKEHRP
jgi:hypothetical protein